MQLINKSNAEIIMIANGDTMILKIGHKIFNVFNWPQNRERVVIVDENQDIQIKNINEFLCSIPDEFWEGAKIVTHSQSSTASQPDNLQEP
jgi:hypothetical protein